MKRAIQAAFLFFLFFFNCQACMALEEAASPQSSTILEQPQQSSIFNKLNDIKKELSNKISQTVLKSWLECKDFILKEIEEIVEKAKNAALRQKQE